jgi:hypothetical protein
MISLHNSFRIALHLSILSFTAIAAISPPSSAATLNGAVLDQEFVMPDGLTGLINEGFTFVGQTYTASLTGTLAGVNIDVSEFDRGNFPLRVAIHEVLAGVPTSTVLSETVLASQSAFLTDFIEFPETILQVTGNQYAIVVNYVGANGIGALGAWIGGTENRYLGGQHVSSNDTITWDTFAEYASFDLHFRTFVLPQEIVPVPEPSSIVGLLALGTLAGCSNLRSRLKNRLR